MRKILQLLLIISAPLLLSACFSTSSDYHHIDQITQGKLASGKIMKIGFKKPKPAWQCRQVAESEHNWAMDKFKGQVEGDPLLVAKHQAVDYANKHHINANYASIIVPDQFGLDDFDLTVFSKAHIYYYQCTYPPALSDKIF